MKEHKRTEEQQKDYIFDTFFKCRSETESNRLQVNSSILCEQIYLWYKDYLSVDVDKMGLEIMNVISNFTKDENISKIPDDKDGFFKYLNTSIKIEEKATYREFSEKDLINIPREKKRKLREVEDFIRMKESHLGRKLTNDEQIQCISKWFKKHEYVDLLNVINVGGLTFTTNNDDNEIDVLNFVDTNSVDPLDEYINKTDMETVREAVKSLLDKKQERARDCYKALFTLHCVKKDLKELYPILDQEIIDSFHKEEKKPKQYEIYLKYHPEVDKSSAEPQASTNLNKFLHDIKTYLKEKNK